MKDALPVPKRMRRLPVDDSWHLPIPVFANGRGGVDFQALDYEHLRSMVRAGLCAMCGQPVEPPASWWCIGAPESLRDGDFIAEAIGHRECVTYAFTACPWLRVAVYRRRSQQRADVGEVKDPNKPAVWGLAEARNPQLYDDPDSILVNLVGTRVRELYGYVDGKLKRVTKQEANALLRAADEEEL